MKKLSVFSLIVSFLFILSCEDKKDTTPPELTISYPLSGSTIGEVVSIKVITIDNSGILKVDFYIDNTMMVSDTTSPYDYEWNTTTVSEGSHTIKVVSHDTKENFSKVELVVTVDNDSKKPSPLDIVSVDYTVDKMTVKWNQSQESDFKQYNLHYSESENGTKTLVKTITDKTITTYDTTSFDPHKENWYFLEVVDTFGLSNIGKGKTSIINLNPTQVEIDSINYSYDKQSFEIYWTQNSDNDFKSYSLYESENEDMSSKKELTVITDQSINNYENPINSGLFRYYQIVVEDNYGLKFTSNTKRGDSHDWFVKTIGGTSEDIGHSIQQTTDGGYIIVGYTRSFGNGFQDVWLIKTNAHGIKQWSRTYGDIGPDGAYSVLQTTDGGYTIAGGKSIFYGSGNSQSNVWLINTDQQGDEQWTKGFGEVSSYDMGFSVQQTTDGGYITFGHSSGSMWLCKIAADLAQEWIKTFGVNMAPPGNYGYGTYDGQQTTDGGYIMVGDWLIKTDPQGDKEWIKENIKGNSVQQTTDGGYIITGLSDDGNLSLIKTDSQGTEEWNKTFGGNSQDRGHSVQQTTDGGFIIVGRTGSYGVGGDVWLIKTDSQGTEEWNKTFGGANNDVGHSVQQTTDGGYIITGWTRSYGSGHDDVWLIKTDSKGNTADYK